jgi:hypothetical protein
MSAFGTISITWSHGTDDFSLAKIGSRLDLEEKCKSGLGAVMQRLQAGLWYTADYRETIRIALIGGGMKPEAAKEVIERHVDGNPQGEFVLMAQHIIASVMVAPPGEQPGKNQAASRTRKGRNSSMPKADSPDSRSMASAAPSSGLPGK